MLSGKTQKIGVFIPYFEDAKTKLRESKQIFSGHLLVAKQGFTFSSVPLQRHTLLLNLAASQFMASIDSHKGRGLDNIW